MARPDLGKLMFSPVKFRTGGTCSQLHVDLGYTYTWGRYSLLAPKPLTV